MEHNAKNICKPVITSKEQNFNKQMVKFEILDTFSIIYAHVGQI